MKMMKLIWSSVLCLFLTSLIPVFGQEASIKAEISKDTIYAGQPFKLRITILNHAGNYSPPDLSGLQMIGGPSQSSQFSMIQGKVEQSVQYIYQLIAKEPAMISLGRASSSGQTGTLETPEIVLEIFPSADVSSIEDSWNIVGERKDTMPDKPKMKTKKF